MSRQILKDKQPASDALIIGLAEIYHSNWMKPDGGYKLGLMNRLIVQFVS